MECVFKKYLSNVETDNLLIFELFVKDSFIKTYCKIQSFNGIDDLLNIWQLVDQVHLTSTTLLLLSCRNSMEEDSVCLIVPIKVSAVLETSYFLWL